MAQINKDDAMENPSKSASTSSEILEGTLAEESTRTSQATSQSKAAQSTLKKHEKRDASESSETNSKGDNSASKSTKSSPKPAVKPAKTSRFVSFILLLLVVFSLFLLLMGMQNTQALNELRNDLNQVQHKQSNIMDQQDALSGQLTTSVSSSEANEKLERLSSEVLKVQNAMETMQVKDSSDRSADIETLLAKQAAFEASVQSELQQALETVKTLQTPVQTSEGEVDLAPILQKVAMLEQQLNRLSQQAEESVNPVASTDIEAAEATKVMLDAALLQQWIFEANTQWLLGASAEATIDKLNAIEQAAVNGGFSSVTALARLIGQDVATLKEWFEISKQPLPSLDELYAAVSALAPPKLELQQAESMPEASTQAVQSDALQVGEVAEQETAWQRLLSRLSEMVTIKNRQTTGEPTTVEALLQHDLQKQRLLLLIERMEWSAQHESQTRYELSIDQVQKFVNQNFSDYSKQFEGLLQPFRAFERKGRQPLVTAGFHVKPSNN